MTSNKASYPETVVLVYNIKTKNVQLNKINEKIINARKVDKILKKIRYVNKKRK